MTRRTERVWVMSQKSAGNVPGANGLDSVVRRNPTTVLLQNEVAADHVAYKTVAQLSEPQIDDNILAWFEMKDWIAKSQG